MNEPTRPIERISTRRILADRALQKTCGRECVLWAAQLMEHGHGGDWLTRLAGQLPPYHHFEIAELRERVLSELNVPELSPEQALRSYAAESFRSAIHDDVTLANTLSEVAELYRANDYVHHLHDFYLLHLAYMDLLRYSAQRYWPNADKNNILTIVRERVNGFLQTEP